MESNNDMCYCTIAYDSSTNSIAQYAFVCEKNSTTRQDVMYM